MDVMDCTRHLEKACIPMLQAANYGEWNERVESALVMKDLPGAQEGRMRGHGKG